MFGKALFLIVPILLVTACNLGTCPCNDNAPEDELSPSVNLQVTEYKDAEAFERIIVELETREITATILTKPDFVTENCERIRALHSAGFEIMAFARPESVDGESMTLSVLSYEEQEEHISAVKDAIEDCIGATVQGFRCTRFDQNEDTYDIVDSLGFEFNLGFVAHTDRCFAGHEDDTLPYLAPGHDFWVVPMHSALFDGEWVAFCDNPFERRVDAAGWEELLKTELDNMHQETRPLLVEVHPYNSGTDEGFFNAFVNFLDYAEEQNASFITVEELVERSQLQASAADDEPCESD